MESDFSASFINVGSADCTLIKCGDKSVLIDGGTNLVTDKITAYLKRSSVTHLDAVIVSHPDSDHIGSLPDIIDEFGTDVVYFGKYSDSHKTPEYERLVNSIKENNINKIGFSLATLATAPKTLDFPTFFCCWRVAAIAGNVTLKPCVAGILMGTYENQKS